MLAPEADEAAIDRRPPDAAGRRVLVCAAGRPPDGTGRTVDVRPGTVATFDGDRLRLPLTVAGADRRTRVAWIDRTGLDAAVSAMLEAESAGVVRFGDRSVCRRLLGPDTTAAVERRLAATARAAGARFITWTTRHRREVDSTSYDVVVDAATGSD